MPEVTSRQFEMSDPGTLSINQLKVSLIVVEAGKLIGVAVEPRNMRPGLAGVVPDLSWTINELFVSGGDKTIVRGEATGAPIEAFRRGPKWRLCHALNQDLQQFIGVSFDGPTNLDKFYNIDAPLAAFVFGDKGLRLTESFGRPQYCCRFGIG
jgi:hypothetical protein